MSMTTQQSSNEKLALALEKLNNPNLTEMIQRARDGYYNEFTGELNFPIIELVQDLEKHRLHDLAKLARNGEFDATPEEADAWAASPEGQFLVGSFGSIFE